LMIFSQWAILHLSHSSIRPPFGFSSNVEISLKTVPGTNQYYVMSMHHVHGNFNSSLLTILVYTVPITNTSVYLNM